MDTDKSIDSGRRQIVITGIGGITPMGNCFKQAHAQMCSGQSSVSEISKFDTKYSKVKYAGEVSEFDIESFGLEKRDIKQLSSINSWGLAAAEIALEDSSLSLKRNPLKGAMETPTNRNIRIGVSIGSSNTDFKSMFDSYQKVIERANGDSINPKFISPNLLNRIRPVSTAALVSIRYGLAGPMLCPNGASATGSASIIAAADAIRLNRADVMLAGGADSGINPLTSAVFERNKSASFSGSCRAFDKNRDGVVLGEGACLLVLEELQHALKRNAKIYGFLSGYATSNDCFDMSRIPSSALGLTDSINLCLHDSGTAHEEITYINPHATATPLNDVAETNAINNTFKNSPRVSAFKGYTGHMLAASGAFEVAMTLYSMNKNLIPQTCGLVNVDNNCILDHIIKRPAELKVKHALSLNCGMGGMNTVIQLTSTNTLLR